ncbi:MAG: glycosyltransferase family 61 protein [Lentisphaeria bacterium]|nr:glycosyltransferase family 61 protein [Lentisphaeria bacterium]
MSFLGDIIGQCRIPERRRELRRLCQSFADCPKGLVFSGENTRELFAGLEHTKIYLDQEESRVEQPGDCLPGDEHQIFCGRDITLETIVIDSSDCGEFFFANNYFFLRNRFLIHDRTGNERYGRAGPYRFRNLLFAPSRSSLWEIQRLSDIGRTIGPVTELDAPVFFMSTYGNPNYYHWLFEPTLLSFRVCQEHVQFPDGMYYYVGDAMPKTLPRFVSDTCQALAIGKSQLVWGNCRAPRMIGGFASSPAGSAPSPRQVHFLRDLFLPAGGQPSTPKRIYVARGNTRKRRVANEQELIQALRGHGVVPVVMDGLSIWEQATLFHNAELIIAPNGAALTNLAFGRSGATVVEIHSGSYVNPSCYVLANLVGMNYCYAFAQALGPNLDSHYTMDVAKMRRLLRRIGVH